MLGAAPLKATQTKHILVLRRLNDELSQIETIESSLEIEFCQERTPASSEEAAWLNHCHINIYQQVPHLKSCPLSDFIITFSIF